jgi:hypothetical protein
MLKDWSPVGRGDRLHCQRFQFGKKAFVLLTNFFQGVRRNFFEVLRGIP